MSVLISQSVYVKVTATCDLCGRKETHSSHNPLGIVAKSPNLPTGWIETDSEQGCQTKAIKCPDCAALSTMSPAALIDTHEVNILTDSLRNPQQSRAELIRRLNYYEAMQPDSEIDLCDLLDGKAYRVEDWPPLTLKTTTSSSIDD